MSWHRYLTGTRGLILAALVAWTAGPGCSSKEDDRPLLPCGVEERNVDGELFGIVYRGYDERGNHVLSERYTPDGTLADRFVWEYAPHGGLLRATTTFGSGRMRDLALQYGADDERLSATWTGLDDERGRADYEHRDDAGIVIERWDYGDDGTVEETVTYTYGPDGKLQGITTFDNCKGEPVDGETTMQWDEQGRIERVENWAGDELSAHSEYSYSEEGLLESMQRWFGDILVMEETYGFDARDNVSESSFGYALFSGGDPSWMESRSAYDAEGRILRREHFSNGQPGGTDTYLYECPDFEDTPGRSVGVPDLAAPTEMMGPRGKVGPDAVTYYAGSRSCPPVSAAR